MTLTNLEATMVLERWQESRDGALTPEQRIEMAFHDFLLPRPPCLVEYQATLRRVGEAMQEECFA